MAKTDPRKSLERYREMRSASTTPEPFGGEAVDRPGLFVVQKHAARRLHLDLRLELDGVLYSWAVPHGFSLDPQQKRLAVETEPHPLEYADFEGVIPEGNYGAGAMIVWDRGRYQPLLEMHQALEDGKLLFQLEGYKLRGVWTLVRTREPRQWLLIKKPDAWASSDADPFPEESVLSGLTVEQLAAGETPQQRLQQRLAELGAPRRELDPARVEPMLAQSAERPFSRQGWIFELKYDGWRLLASLRGGRAGLRLRSGRDASRRFPELTRALVKLPCDQALIDGEAVVLDAEGRPVFQRLQQRAQLQRDAEIERAAVEHPATLYAFDLLALDGHDLRELPLVDRKLLLHQLLPRLGPLRYADHVETQGAELHAEVQARGLEGVIGKRADSHYRAGRSDDWLKLRADRSGDFVVVGWTDPKSGRSGFGALHVAAAREGRLEYAGRVGSGFSQQGLEELSGELAGLERPSPPDCAGELPAGPEHHWVEPELVVELRYRERTRSGNLRLPVFLRWRRDRGLAELLADSRTQLELAEPSEPPPRVELARLDKPFWPADGITKGDLLGYYEAISPWLLPWLRDRPVVLVRYPDGIEGKSFFQKRPPGHVPSWLRSASIWSEDSQEDVHHFVVDDLQGLLYLINLGTIPLHVRAARLGSLAHPDWCVLDLDPKGAAFEHVVVLARAIHALCDSIELPSHCKTSGSEGLHVLIPLGGQLTHEQSRQLAELLAGVVARQHPKIATVARSIAKRQGRVYIDALQNGQGKLLVAPFSVRPLPGAPVSMPLKRGELRRGLDIRRYTLRNAPRRLARLGSDPLAPLLDEHPDVLAALERLSQRL